MKVNENSQNDAKKYYVYLIQNKENKKMYIGWSSNVKQRWASEKNFAFNPNYQMYNWTDYKSLLSRAFRKYALNAKDVDNHFTFLILEEFEDKDESLEAEIFWIEFFRTNVQRYGKDAGYNVLSGGQKGISGYKATDEQKAIISFNNTGEKNSSAKLKKTEVENIRKDYLTGNYSYKDIVNKYKISVTNISRIILNKNWKSDSYILNEEQLLNIKTKNQFNNTGKFENNPNSKLTQSQVNKIRNDFNLGLKSIIELSEEYNMSYGSINGIIKNEMWKDKNYFFDYKKYKEVNAKDNKINYNIVLKIRQEYLLGNKSPQNVADEYDTDLQLIWRILKNEICVDENYKFDHKQLLDIAKKNHKLCKLTYEKADYIRKECKLNNSPQRKKELAKEFEISMDTVYGVINNKIWVVKNV